MSSKDQLYLDQLAADVASGKLSASEALADAYDEGFGDGYNDCTTLYVGDE